MPKIDYKEADRLTELWKLFYNRVGAHTGPAPAPSCGIVAFAMTLLYEINRQQAEADGGGAGGDRGAS